MILISLILFVIVVWAVSATLKATKERVDNGDWWRLAVAGVALLVPVVYVMVT